MRFSVNDLSGQRGGEPVFSGVGFDLTASDALVITGPNGSGKSTLLQILAGLLQAAGGAVNFDGGENWPDVTSASHYVGHENAMKPALTVGENLDFWRDFLGEPRMSAAEALESLGLSHTHHMPFGYLSTGQRRRVSLAKLLVSHRPVWLLDEPTAGLDRTSEVRVAGLIDRHRAEGGIVIAATHVALGVEGAKALEMGAAV